MLGIFKHIKYAICAIFVFCAVALSSNFAFAGYVCPAQTVTYSSCKSGYYMTYKGVYNGTPQAGNLCSACPDGYTCSGGTAAPTITCAAGTRVVTAGAKCTTPSGGWWTPASHTVTYGQVSTVNYCMAGWTNTDSNRLAHISGSYCRKSVAAGNRTINTISARYIKVTTGGNTLNEYSQVVEIQAFASNDGTGTNLLSGKGGISGTNLTNATDGSWARAQYASGAMIWDMGSIKSIGSIKFALYTDGRTYSDVTIAVSTNNSTWTTVLGPIDIATQNVTTATGELVRLKSVLPCTAGTYSDSDSIVGLTGSKLCAACAIGSYASGTGNTGCTACQNGTTTTATGQSSCNAACSNAIGVTEFYPDVVWNTDNTLTRLCDNYQYCDEGYYISRDGVWADDSDESLVDNEGWFLAGTVCSTCPDDAAHCPGRVKSPVYPVTFNFQGGTADFSTMYTSQDSTCSFYLQYSYTSGSCITKLEVPTRTGYTFKGYYTAASGGTQVASADGTMLAAINTAVPKNAPSTLYAQWTVNTSAMQADLYFRCEDGSYAKKADGSNAIFTSGYACEDLEQSFICDGKYVTGWDDDLENVGGLPNSEVCDFVTYAIDTYGANTGINFTAKSYGDGVTSTVTLNNNGGTGGTSSVNATYGSAMPSATMPMRPGYMFSGYYDTNEETGGTSYYTSSGASARNWDKTSATTLYARWTLCPSGAYCPGTADNNSTASCPTDTANRTPILTPAGSDSATDCYVTCPTTKTVANAKTVTVVDATPNYNGSAYPACAYNVTCNDGYSATNNGTATPSCSANTIKCDAGTYLEGDTATCKDCPLGYGCPGGTFEFDGSDRGLEECSGDDQYQNLTKQTSCKTVDVGYYKYTNTEQKPCTNKPSNASYTTSGTSATTCSWQCNANYYKSGNACTACSTVSYTDSGTDTETIAGGTRTRTKTRTCYRATSSAGSTAASACSGTSSCGAYTYGAWVARCASDQGYTPSADGTTCNNVYKLTLDSKYYSSATATGVAVTTNASPTVIYEKYRDTYYTDAAATTAFTKLTTMPKYNKYIFGGFWMDKTYDDADKQIIDSYGNLNSAKNKSFKADATLYARYLPCTCTKGSNVDTCTVTGTNDNNQCTYSYTCANGYHTSGEFTGAVSTASNKSPNCTPNTYTITLNKNHEDAVAGTTTLYTTYATNVYLDSARTQPMITSANGIKAPTRSYTVTYDANGGSVSPSSSTSNYTFNGYYSATSGGTQYTGSTYILAAGLTAGKGYTSNANWYAQWTGKAITLPTPTRTGYTFNGWYTAATGGTKIGAAGASYTPTANIKLYAQWTANTYTVAYSCGDADTGATAPSSATATYNSDFTPATNTCTKQGHDFAGWIVSNTSTPDVKSAKFKWTYLENKTFTAKWTAKQITCQPGQFLNITSCKSCTAGYKCPSVVKTYTYDGSNQGRTACSGATEYQNATGQTTCKTVSDGYYKTSNSAQSACGTGYYCKDSVRTQCPNSGTTSKTTASVITECYKTGLAYSASNGSGTQTCYYTSGSGTSAVYNSSCTSKKITSCVAGYYLKNTTDTDCSVVGSGYYSEAGDTERDTCPAGYNAGSSTAAAITDCKIDCPAATYLKTAKDSTCTSADTGYWAIGDVVAYGSTSKQTQCPANYRAGAGASAEQYCQTECAASTYVATAKSACTTVGGGYWSAKHNVYYGSTSTDSRNQCPENYRAGAATTSEGGCITSCADGTAVKTAKAACVAVGSGYYMESHTVFYGNKSGTIGTCPTDDTAGRTVKSAAGADAKTDCYVSCGAKTISDGTASVVSSTIYYNGSSYPACTYNTSCNPGFYGADGVSNPSCTACAAGKYSAANATTCTDCAAGSYSAAGASACTACAAGTTSAKGSGTCSACSNNANVSAWDTPSWTANTTSNVCSVKTCAAGYSESNNACVACTYTVKYNANGGSGTMSSSTHTYDVAKTLTANTFTRAGYTFAGWATSTSGSVVHADKKSVSKLTTTCGGTVNLYAVWSKCASGSYCPGDNTSIKCPTAYPNSAAGSDNANDCYLTTSAGKYVATQGAGQVECEEKGYCAGGTKVWYSTGNGSATGGRTACPTAYPNSAAGSDNANDCYLTTSAGKYVATQGAGQVTCVGGNYCAGGTKVWYSTGNGSVTGGSTACPELYPNSADGASHNYECYLTTTPGNYVAEAAEGETPCEYGSYCPGGIVIYYNTGKGNHLGGSAKCAVGSYASGTGNSACTVCGNGKTTASAGSSSASACIACSNNTGVSAWETASWTYSGVSSNSVKNLCMIDTCSAGYTLASNACGINTYSITYYDGSSKLSLSPSSYKVTSSDITLPTPYKAGKKFVSWHTDSTLTSTAVTKIAKGSTGNKTFYVKWTDCPAGYACNGSSITQCTGNTYAGAGASSCTSCPAATGWEITSAFLEQNGITDANGTSTGTMANRVRVKETEMIHLNAGTYTVTFKNTSAGVVMRGFYTYSTPDDTSSFITMKSGSTLTLTEDAYVRMVFQKSNASTAITPAEVVSAGATLNKTSAYVISGTATTDHDNVNDCKISCPSGSYVAVAGGVCVPVASGKYVAAKTVAYGSTNSASSCPATNSGSDSGRATNKTCYYTCPSKTVSNGTATVVSSKVYYTGSAYPTCTYTVKCNTGYSASGSGTATPSCTACPYTVTYNSNKPSNASGTISGSTANSSHTYDTAKALTTNGYKLTGWTFQNWNTAADGTGTTYTDGQSVKNLTATCNGTVTLYAQWKANTYTVTYNSNKPSTATATISGSTANSSHTYDTAKALTANGYKLTGYTFKGWSTSNTATSATYADKESVKNLTATNGATVTLYAVWSANCIPVTFNMNYTDSLNPPQTVTLWKKADATGWYIDNACSASYSATANSSIILPGDVYFYDADSKEPYVFRGFYDKAHSDATNNTTIAVQYFMTDGVVSTAGANLTINSPITVYAAWATPCQAPSNGTCNLAVDTDGDTHYSATCKDGYTLSGYDTYNPSCTANTYTVAFNSNKPSGASASISGTMSNQARTYDDNVALTANAFKLTGWTFQNWNTAADGSGTKYTNKQVANLTTTNGATVTLYAQWKANTYTVTFNTNGATSGSASVSSVTCTYDSACSAASQGSMLKTNSVFKGWGTSSSATSATYSSGGSIKNISTGSAVTLYAVWGTCTACSAGTGATCSMSVTNNTCTYTTACKTGYNTLTNNGKYNPSCTANTYTVAYDANGGSGTTASSSHTYDVSKALTANGFTNGTKKFLGWSTSNTATSATYTNKQSVKNLTATNEGTVTLYAIWSDCQACSAGTGASCTLSAPLGVCTYTTACKTGYNTLTNSGKYNPSCTANTYTVAYDANGGSGATASSSHTYDVSKALTANGFTNGTKKFLGWSTSKTATSATYTNKQSVKNLTETNEGTVTLYAVWGTCTACSAGTGASCTLSAPLGVCTYTTACKTGYNTLTNSGKYNPSCTANTYTVAYDANGGTGTTASSSHTYDVAKALTANGYALSGHVFSKWNTAADGSGTAYADKASVKNLTATNGATVTLYAQWTRVSCTATNATCGTVTVTNNVPSVTITCNEGYSKTGTTDRTHSFTVTGSAGATSLSGSCSAQCNVVAIDPNGGVSGSITTLYKKTGSGTWYTNNTCTTSYSTTKNVLPTRSGYTLRGLYDTKYADVDSDNNVGQRLIALSGNSGTLGNAWKITEDTSLYAAWAKNCVTPNNGTCSLTIKDYGYTDYTTTCNDGYSISGNNTATPSCTGNKITLKFANGGHGTAPTSPASCTYGSTFTMPSAMSATGYTFNKWSVNGNTFGAGQTNVTCNYTNLGVYSGTATITGTWNLIEYTITYNLNGGTNSSSNPSSYTIETATITLANPTKNGYTFAGWYDASTGGNKVTQIAKGSTGNKTFYARWNNCGAGYWCANGGKTACSSGLTTIGYGAGADEAGDCGRVLYVGGQKLYLRSTEKTDVSLHVKVGGTTFYGNMVVGSKKMSAGATKTLKIKHKGQVYSVYDDSAN